MLKHLAAVVALGLGAALPASVPQDSIDDVIDREMPSSGVPGLAYAVVSDGDITEVGARGVTRAGSGVDVTPDTPFMSGSISKSFTALAVMQLVEAAQVDLEAGISQYLDEFSATPAGAITTRQLLDHTSGFSTYQGNSSHTDAGGEDELARRVEALSDLTPAYPPGQRWEYSNANYLVLGRLVEVLGGQHYQGYVTANILEPIGMTDSFVSDDVLSAEGKAQMMRPGGGAATFYGFGWLVDTGKRTVWHTGSTPGVETIATMMPTEKTAVVVLVNGGSGVGFGETAQLRNGITSRALDLDYDGEGSRLSQQALFLGMALLPIFYLLSMVWAWTHRTPIRAKPNAGFAGLFSLWFPLLTTVVAAWVIVVLVPGLLGAPLTTISLFQPDMGLALIASALTGVLWSGFRLAVAYTGRAEPGSLGPTVASTSATAR